MTEQKDGGSLDIALLNGLVLSIIGVLVLLMPFFAEMTDRQRIFDWVAGGVLVLGGLGLLVFYFTRGSKSAG